MLVAMETGTAAKSRWGNDIRLELMRTEWNSAVARLKGAAAEPSKMMQHTIPSGMAGMDVDAFLQVMTAARCLPG